MRYYRISIYFKIIRNFFFSKTNKEFLIFLFFLCLSGTFWLLMTLNETYEKEFSIPVRLINVPKNVIITNDLPGSIRITAKDKGFVLLTYIYGQTRRPLTVDFNTYANESGHGKVPTNDLFKQITSLLNGSTKLTSIKPDIIDFYFNQGYSKRVPVRLSGKIVPEKMYYLARTKFWPDSVTIYATRHLLDSIKEMYTEPIYRSSLSDTTIIRAPLRKVKGVKCVPYIIKIGLYPDIFTEESIDVPIVGINMPDGQILRTFPSKVSVTFTTGVSVFRQIRPENFSVIVDYKEIADHPSDKCNIYLRTMPHGVNKVRLSIKQVDYLIEQE
jgi:hypothetical protein